MRRNVYVAVPDRPGAVPAISTTNKGRVVVDGGILVIEETPPPKAKAAVAATVGMIHSDQGPHAGVHPEDCDLGCREAMALVAMKPGEYDRLV